MVNHIVFWIESGDTANCIIIAQVPIENHSDQGQFTQLPLETIGKVQNLGDCYAIRSKKGLASPGVDIKAAVRTHLFV